MNCRILIGAILRNLESPFILWIQIDIHFLASTTYLLMSENAYQKLTPEQQAIFKEAGAEATKYSVEVGIKADTEIVDFLKAQGMQVNDADVGAFVEPSQSIWTDWAAEHGEDASALIDMISKAGG